jgi:hypothetical protein
MSVIASKSVSRSALGVFTPTVMRFYARVRFALRRFAALYAEARIRQAANEIRRFEECHRPLSEREDGSRSRLADDALQPSK